MTTTISRSIARVRNLCNKVARSVVDDEVILEVLHRTQTSMNNELNLASTNRLVEKAEFALTAQEMEIPVADFESAERVMIMNGGDSYSPLSIVGLDQMPGMTTAAASSDASVVAFVGGRMYFDGVPPNAMIQLWYKPTYSEPESLADSFRGVSESYVPLLELRAAAFIRENFLDLTVTRTMDAEMMRLERQFKVSRTRGDESGLVRKSRYRGAGRGERLAEGAGRHRLIR